MKLQKAMYNAAVNELLIYQDKINGSVGELSQLLDLISKNSHRILESGWDVFQTSAQREALLTAHLERMKFFEKVAVTRLQSDGPPEAVALAEYWRLDAEIRLLKYRQSLNKTDAKISPVIPCCPTQTQR